MFILSFTIFLLLVLFLLGYPLYQERIRWNAPYFGVTTENAERFYPDAFQGILTLSSEIKTPVQQKQFNNNIRTLKNLTNILPSEPGEKNSFDILLQNIFQDIKGVHDLSCKKDRIQSAYEARLFHATKNSKLFDIRDRLDVLYRENKTDKIFLLIKETLGEEKYTVLHEKACLHNLLTQLWMRERNIKRQNKIYNN